MFMLVAGLASPFLLLAGCNAPTEIWAPSGNKSAAVTAAHAAASFSDSGAAEAEASSTPTAFLPLPVTPVEGQPEKIAETHSPTEAAGTAVSIDSGNGTSSTTVSTASPTLAPAESPIPSNTPTRTTTPTPTRTLSTPPPPSPTDTAAPPTATLPATDTEAAQINPTATATYTPTDTKQPPSPTATVAAACSPSGNGALENAVIAGINNERTSRGLTALSAQSQLSSAARLHSADMACNDFVSHTGSDDSLPWDRVAGQGYSYSAVGENIYAGGGNAEAIVNAWMGSTGHRENILNAAYTEIGLGYRFWSDSTYGAYVTAVFARPR
jgi:uncharacterized protein YkwD